MPILQEDKHIKLGGQQLPGVIKKLEVQPSALIEEVEVEGSSVRPKQAVGYDDVHINIELILDDTERETILQQIERVMTVYRASSQSKPQPVLLVCPETAAAGVSQVLIKDISYSRTNKNDQVTLTLTLWEYNPMAITATSTRSGNTAVPSLSAEYQSYLDNDRGSAARGGYGKKKLSQSPAIDDAKPGKGGGR